MNDDLSWAHSARLYNAHNFPKLERTGAGKNETEHTIYLTMSE